MKATNLMVSELFSSQKFIVFNNHLKGQSKTANMLFAVELNRRYKDEGIFSNSLMPGVIMTNLAMNIFLSILIISLK
jgi:NAD(P)-dependent dehydrogenase (short-subunit alcohol dehydrogenase family)